MDSFTYSREFSASLGLTAKHYEALHCSSFFLVNCLSLWMERTAPSSFAVYGQPYRIDLYGGVFPPWRLRSECTSLTRSKGVQLLEKDSSEKFFLAFRSSLVLRSSSSNRRVENKKKERKQERTLPSLGRLFLLAVSLLFLLLPAFCVLFPLIPRCFFFFLSVWRMFLWRSCLGVVSFLLLFSSHQAFFVSASAAVLCFPLGCMYTAGEV